MKTSLGVGRRLCHAAALGVVMVGGIVWAVAGPTNDVPRMLFLRVQLREPAPLLRDWSVRPGHVKPRVAAEDAALRVEVQDATGRVLWQTAMPDPRLRRIEAHDPAGPERAAAQRVRIEQPEFTVRVPLLPEARWVEFFVEDTASDTGGPRRGSLGRLKLPVP